jgi:phospholipid/cholesterol/gamma-HCH transport system substrate-binding protein
MTTIHRNATRDFTVGVFVLAGIAAVAYLSFSVGGLSLRSNGGFILYAGFDQIGGLKPRAKVEISGVRVGQVEAITLDEDLRARVELDLQQGLELPIDTTASIVTAGLLGDQYISLQIGGEDELLKPGETITFTESAVILERLIGQFVHSTNVGDGQEKEGVEAEEEKAE